MRVQICKVCGEKYLGGAYKIRCDECKSTELTHDELREFELIHYFDVYKDECDCWTVNNQCRIEDKIVILDSVSEKEILKYLVKIGFLSTADRRKVYLVDDGEIIEIYQRKGDMPIGALMQKINW